MARRTGGEREWVGGRLSAPMYVTEGEPYRPDMILWLELPDGLIVGSELVHPSAPPAVLVDVLTRAMQRPMVGPPRRPARIRIADPGLAELLAAALADRPPVRVAPTPELHDVLAHLAAHAGAGLADEAEPDSYLEGGRLSPALVGELFVAAERLYGLAPWKRGGCDVTIRVDIPALGINAASLTIIGSLGQDFGFLLFPSLAAHDAFNAAFEQRRPGGPLDLGTEFLALSFERRADIPADMRREVAAHRWPVAGARAWPRLARRERDGLCAPLGERDVRVATACANALVTLWIRHGETLADGSFRAISESYTDNRQLTVRLTLPHEADALFDIDPPAASARAAGRNDPCPCGSGRKYKKCHLGQALPAAAVPPAPLPAAGDPRLIGTILEWAAERHGTAWAAAIGGAGDEAMATQLIVPWCAFHATVGGRPLAAHFADAHAAVLSDDLRAWFAAQLAAWLSIWEVTEVEPGVGASLTDLLTGERRRVRDRAASQTLTPRTTVLARIVDHDGESALWGLAPRGLPPLQAAEVVRLVRGRLRRQRAVPIERLRDEALGRYLFARWQEAVDALDEQARIPPVLQNTDGDPLLLTVDHFALQPGARGALGDRLVAAGGEPDGGRPHAVYVFHAAGRNAGRDAGRTIIGVARLTDAALRLETNSQARADALRQRIESACGDLVQHRLREHTDPHAMLAGGAADPTAAAGDGAPVAGLDPAEARALERELMGRHYERWLDEPVPALDGQTPRAAARTAAGRRRVDLLLRDIEYREARRPPEQRFDFTVVRRALGLLP